ncbi:MAG: thermonuclease family protein [Gammaproteobacteria bacterium]|nr:thermonuclease family protein [Gammaproteobacteria bacterium]
MHPSRCLIALLFATSLGASADAADLAGRVLRIVDGDTFVMDVRGAQYQVDIASIDAPESNQPWGDVAAATLSGTLSGRFVVVETTQLAAGRARGRVTVRGRDVGLDLLYDGLAWATVQFEPPLSLQPPEQRADHPYLRAEQEARLGRRGLWRDARPLPPWQWRRPQQLPPAG